MDDAFRNTGRSTRQMQEAPEGAHYIIPTSWSTTFNYFKHLSISLFRTDLILKSPENATLLHPAEVKHLVVDHAVAECAPFWARQQISELAAFVSERNKMRGLSVANDPLADAEKYLFPDRLTDADKEDAPRVIRALAGKLSAYRIFGTDVVTESALLKVMSDTSSVDYQRLATAIMDKFKVVKK